jgi:DNA-binding transcriptional regulator GbsR (MarR family)
MEDKIKELQENIYGGEYFVELSREEFIEAVKPFIQLGFDLAKEKAKEAVKDIKPIFLEKINENLNQFLLRDSAIESIDNIKL